MKVKIRPVDLVFAAGGLLILTAAGLKASVDATIAPRSAQNALRSISAKRQDQPFLKALARKERLALKTRLQLARALPGSTRPHFPAANGSANTSGNLSDASTLAQSSTLPDNTAGAR